ncbi:gliding motility-associated C-terminal domain-containing protein [Filimonas lacunae]|uniref:Gliding motility-associated C-terminal domain-containing protein n=1 Tax=Filimonas lacunae TaxID=477680 RepID=A0A173MDU0_9BACT|nr:PKD domain-containing protein [Filimonas lacunae]BAV05598.1 hypothetical protein FLA_1609 [Filimonas lacunae]SIT29248.1 gliding motility-associated C-terminal domain-containing protein [Filimonas lacunae]
MALWNTGFSQPPKAAFTVSTNSTGCAPLIVQLKDASTGSPTWWKWDFGNGTISTQQNPGAIYTDPGTYTIKLVAGNASGSDSVIQTEQIKVYGKPEVAFSTETTNGCIPMTVLFTDSSNSVSGAITSYIWDFGDGQISAQATPTHTYTESGSFDISLTVQNSYGCKQSLQKKGMVQVAGKVKAAYNYTYVNACQPPTRVQFTNTSTDTGALQYQWSFGDGATSTDASPEHIYDAAGDYMARLVAISTTGCTDTIIQKIAIGGVTPAFTANANACTGKELFFTNTSAPAPVSSTWSFGDNSSYTGNNAVHTFANPGNYTVTLYTSFGTCTDSVKKVINVSNKPISAFSASGTTTACTAPATVSFTNNASGAASYIWYFGDATTSFDPNPVHTYTKKGYYTVSLISFNAGGCSDTVVKEKLVRIGSPRISSIKNLPYKGCTPATIAMQAIMNEPQSVTTWLWNFGDGTTSDQVAPTHTYTQEGVYNVSVIIRTNGGCVDTFTLQNAVTLATAPKTAFSANPVAVCGSKPIYFTDASTGKADSWLWNFGDGNGSTQANPQHPYKDTGNFTITLITGNKQCYDTLEIKNYIHVKVPIARFSSEFKCETPYTRTFTDNSVAATSWHWDFGDGTTATTQNATHKFADTGLYNVELIVWNDACSDTMRMIVRIIDEHPNFTHTPGEEFCRKEALIVNATNYTTTKVTAFIWDFGDSSNTSVQLNKVTHLYNKTGTYTVSLTTVDLNGCYDKSEKQVYIEVFGNKAGFTNPAGVCLQDGTVNFTDKSTTDGSHPITQWKWSYGDGDSATYSTAPFSHTYKKAGTYTVKMIITDSYGCADTVTKSNAVIIASPKAAFAVKDSLGCAGSTVSFTNTSQGLSLAYRWNFGDGSATTTAAPTHPYAKEGDYDVALKVTDKFGCTDSLLKEQLVFIANPIASFHVVDTFANCPPLIASPASTSQNVSTLYWDFDDGTTSNLDKPDHAYTQGGVFNLTLIAKGHGNCYDTAVHTISIKGPSGKYTFTPSIACAPAAVAFKATVKNTASLAWDFSDGTVTAGEDLIVSHTYPNQGAYVPKLVLIDSNNCKVAITNKDTLYVRDIKAQLSTTLQTGCDSALVAFKDSSQVWYDEISSYSWSFGDNTAKATGTNTQHYYYNDGNYHVKLVVTTAKGCSDSITTNLNIPVYQSPQPVIKAVDSVCYNSTMQFSGKDSRSNSAITSWLWQLGNGQSAPGQSNPYTYPYPGKYNVTLQAINEHGCIGTAQHTVTVLSLPALDAGSDTSICLGQPLTLQPSGADKYVWTSKATISCNTCATAVTQPTSGTRYYLKGSSAFGCVSYDSLFVDVKQPAQLMRMAADTLCTGESAQLQTSGAETYQWFPAKGLNNAHIPNPVASPAETTTYTVIGRDTKNCFSDSQSVVIKVYPIPQFTIVDSVHNVNVGYPDTLQTINSADITRWRWVPATGLSCATCPNPVVLSKQDITYVAHAYNDGGCTSQDEVTVHVLCNGINVFMPNTFSPNSDGMNDQFYPRGRGLYNIRALRIFNRWGQPMFEKLNFLANTASYGWDGTYGGQPAQSGVYVYVMEIECDNGTVMTYKGNVALLR